MRGTRWTPAEIELLRAVYPDGGADAAVAVLPSRNRNAILQRASILGLGRRLKWTPEESARLVRLWNSEMSLREIAAHLKRSEVAVYLYGTTRLGLPAGCPDGWEYLTEAARRCGFASKTMRSVLEASKATIRRALSFPKKSTAKPGSKKIRLRYIVSPGEVDAAVADWNEREPVQSAARRIGVHRSLLLARLKDAGVARARPLGRPRKNARPYWRVSVEDIAVALGVEPEDVAAAQRGTPLRLPMAHRPAGRSAAISPQEAA